MSLIIYFWGISPTSFTRPFLLEVHRMGTQDGHTGWAHRMGTQDGHQTIKILGL